MFLSWQCCLSSAQFFSWQPLCLLYRWIERYNNKLRQPAKKEEARRMKQFVNDAFAQDPRILQRRAEEKAQRCTPKLACCITDRLYWFWSVTRDRSVAFVLLRLWLCCA